jgi:hypothetical protein
LRWFLSRALTSMVKDIANPQQLIVMPFQDLRIKTNEKIIYNIFTD